MVSSHSNNLRITSGLLSIGSCPFHCHSWLACSGAKLSMRLHVNFEPMMKLTLLNEYLCCLFDNTGNKIIPDPARVLTENMVTGDGRIRATWRGGLRLENTLKSQCMNLRRWSHPNHWLKARSSAHACFSIKQCSLVPRNCSAGFSSAKITWTSKIMINIGEHHVWSWKTIVLFAGSAFFKRQVYIGGLRLCFSLARQFWW